MHGGLSTTRPGWIASPRRAVVSILSVALLVALLPLAPQGLFSAEPAAAAPPDDIVLPPDSDALGFGGNVDVDGDWMAVGASGTEPLGSVFLYERSGAAWVFAQELTGSTNDAFGESVVLDGDTLLVGAPGADFLGNPLSPGSVEVFVYDGAAWVYEATLTDAAGAVADAFGLSVDLDGDTAIVGAPAAENPLPSSGAAAIFQRTGSTWTLAKRLTPAIPGDEALFGYSVAIAGETAVVGAPFDSERNNIAGAAYTFDRAGGAWTQDNKLMPIAYHYTATFGIEVETNGSAIFIGQPHGYQPESPGYVRIYTPFFGTWGVAGTLTGPNFFGQAIDVDGTRLAAASPGVVRIYEKGATWAASTLLGQLDGGSGRQFAGGGVAASDGRAYAGTSITPDVTDGSVLVWNGVHPTVVGPADALLAEVGGTDLAVTLADVDSDLTALDLTATSSNETIIAPGDITLGGAGANRTIALASQPGAVGPVTITLEVTDHLGNTATDSFVVTVGALVEGTVTGSGQPLEGVTVRLTGPGVDRTVVSDLSGGYRFTAVPAGAYTLGFDAPGYAWVNEWWEDQPDAGSADPIPLADNEVSTLDAELAPVPLWGIVRTSASPTSGVVVELYQEGAVVATATTGADGVYTFPYISPATYELRFVPPTAAQRPEWWSKRPDATTADPVVVDGTAPVNASAWLDGADRLEAPRPNSPPTIPYGFGSAMASSETWLAIAATDPGSVSVVYLYERAEGWWWLRQQLTSGLSHDGFGSALAMDDDVLVVGASGDDVLASGAGAAHVFRRNGSTWTLDEVLRPAASAASDSIGTAVAVDGDRIALGAPLDDGSLVDTGAVYMYDEVVSVWTAGPVLTGPSPATGDYFGRSVALRGSSVIVGSPRDDTAASNGGAVHVFNEDGPGFALGQELFPATPATSLLMGTAIDVDDDQLAVTGASAQGSTNSKVFVFNDVAGSWVLRSTMSAGQSTGFGTSVDLEGPSLAVGAPTDSSSGRVRLFRRMATGWTAQESTAPSGCSTSACAFGSSVQVRYGVLGGAPNREYGANGSVRVRTGLGPVIAPMPLVVAPSGVSSTAAELSIWDLETSLADLDVQVSSADLSLLPVGSATAVFDAGAWSLVVDPPANAVGTAAVTVTVTDASGLVASRTLTVSVGGIIEGTVTSGGVAATAVPVRVHGAWGDRTTQTDGSGRYRVSGLESGSYLVEFSRSGKAWATEWWDGAATEAGATPLVLDPSERLVADADLARVSVHGIIESPTGDPIPGIDVSVHQGGAVVAEVVSGSDGTYQISGLPPGTYTLSIHDPAGLHADRWLGNMETEAYADTFNVPASGSAAVSMVMRSVAALSRPDDLANHFNYQQDVAMSGDWLAIALEDGVAFYRWTDGRWQYDQMWGAPTGEDVWDIDLVGDRAVAGTSKKAYPFRLEGATWVAGPALTSPVSASSSYFGQSVRIGGSRLVVAAPGRNGVTGRVLVYALDPSGPGATLTSTIMDPTGDSEAFFGGSLDLRGDLLAVGAPNAAKVHLFTFDGGWLLDETIAGPTPDPFNESGFGDAVAIGVNEVLVGDSTWMLRGRVVVYRPDGLDWFAAQSIEPEVPSGSLFGVSLALDEDDDSLLIGTYPVFAGGVADPGALRYERNPSGWVYAESLLASDLEGPDDRAGGAGIAIDGNRAAVVADSFFDTDEPSITFAFDWLAVDSTADAVDADPGDGLCMTAAGACTLRAAVMETNALPGPDRIVLTADDYVLTRAGRGENGAVTGDLDVTGALEIIGLGAGGTSIDAAGLDRVLQARPGSRLTVRNVTITGGSLTSVAEGGGGVFGDKGAAVEIVDSRVSGNASAGPGGGVFAHEDLVIQSSEIDGNTAGSLGGGVAGFGAVIEGSSVHDNVATSGGGVVGLGLTMSDSSVEANSATTGGGLTTAGTVELVDVTIAGNDADAGGGWYHPNGGRVDATGVDVSGNTATGMGGGALLAGGLVSITDSTVAGNTAADGGALVVWDAIAIIDGSTVSGNEATGVGGTGAGGGVANVAGALTVRTSTISGNQAAAVGGGIVNLGTMKIEWSTITANAAVSTGGVYTDATQGLAASTTTRGTAVVDQAAGADCGGPTATTSLGENGFTSVTCGSNGDDLVGLADAGLLPVGDNGGPTLTHLPDVGSALIDAVTGCPATDQRGQARGVGGVCDVGAVES